MQNNPEQCPTWDEFLKPLLDLANQEPIMRRTGAQKIAEQFSFSQELRHLRTKSGQQLIQNRAGWAMSSLVKATFIEKHPSEKFTYQITDKGREYLQQHEGPITAQDLKNIEGYEEAWEEASRLKQQAKSQTSNTNPDLDQSTPDDLIDSAYHSLNQSLANELIESMLDMDPYKFEQLVVDLLFSMGYGGSRSEAAQVTKNQTMKALMALSTKIALV
ncbi:Mrr restriction system protein [gamma proteobacterium IMCC1989]|nr:Mrr restriction system protein [gamma proteobacterium IMCC1989]